ncbi:MAG TPA: 16S rRNA (adenine(1518)-N(6)/adenine(1519)-N(6))-dimethyltransferase RsmA [Phycisphaerae bacterium]|nr:16S rRNA (adenine(1518)-N(6)/adenine(1519)-N(6))-dimethyltransferase RsmA [Phycisphaerae bacterium]HOJ74929.1 16S rRNA (adenine(1518)-N(6)/adenine(1519)-N(6))-dimethyltransferase RsmA [Phycisphaerae bacterium]HOM51490.1 16S rRNA (adenine(1518)-N(6)/adenine(1519)-N(6))-dimethyltransferase RsmA [Phycisphaerae bacterium]HON68013.1 16S rRNA (adenine(1518)-N(6)/adenine(1519)-N(6))-dimethyltransferase RsmA [Phycisphaerae bacterium]HOQ87254.1 16S rRNA (adenine(1518)-N(6)/adenine(1519)-N(6))-dimethy
MAQTRRQIEALLNGAGIRPLKRFGQNFLIDGNLIRKLVQAAEIRPDDVVLEVGPGTGTLTEELLAVAGHVVAVEIDKGLAGICRDRFGGNDRFTLLHTDVLECKSRIAAAVLETLHDRQQRLGGRMMLVANLPYQAATPLIVDLLLGRDPVSPLCFTVQAEVADRLLATAGGKDYGPISIYAQALADSRRIARLGPQSFWPAPQVDSAMVRLDVRADQTVELKASLARVVHACFLHRRKTLKWSLRQFLDDAALARVAADGRWDLEARPEQLTVGQWVDLAGFLVESPPSR